MSVVLLNADVAQARLHIISRSCLGAIEPTGTTAYVHRHVSPTRRQALPLIPPGPTSKRWRASHMRVSRPLHQRSAASSCPYERQPVARPFISAGRLLCFATVNHLSRGWQRTRAGNADRCPSNLPQLPRKPAKWSHCVCIPPTPVRLQTWFRPGFRAGLLHQLGCTKLRVVGTKGRRLITLAADAL